MTRTQFLDNLIAFYGEDPKNRRSIAPMGPGCFYRSPDGRRCAIGRHIRDKDYRGELENKTASHSDVLAALPEEVRVLGVEFLNACQTLHDGCSYWMASGLSPSGEDLVARIRSKFCQSKPAHETAPAQ